MSVRVKQVVQQHPFLGRQLVHDSKSRGFPVRVSAIDRSTWRSKTIRVYDPRSNPSQCHGECTGVAKCIEFNSVGNRVTGVILTKDDAHKFYSMATERDPFEGSWPPDDTGSSGLASCKAAHALGLGGSYRHIFGGADEVVQVIQLGRVVNIGTWWYQGMMVPDANKQISPVGEMVGGHQYVARGYDLPSDQVMIRCWWGTFRDAWIKREALNALLMDDGDAHIQDRIQPSMV